jgi:NAD(P)-dependent dehydrogenase (short-subunit alcohol dehydrogenase family)
LAKDAPIEEVERFFWMNWSPEDFQSTFEVNTTSVFFTAVAFLSLLDAGNLKENARDTKSQIIVTASIASYLRSTPPGLPYSASKAAVNHLAKNLSTFLIPYGIRVNILNPGVFHSKFRSPDNAFLLNIEIGEMTAAAIGRVPGFTADTIAARRIGTEKDLFGSTLFLCSPAGAYLNGLSLVVDGGTLSVSPSTY